MKQPQKDVQTNVPIYLQNQFCNKIMNSATHLLSDSLKRPPPDVAAKQKLEKTIASFENRLEQKIKTVFNVIMSQSKVQDLKLPSIDRPEQQQTIQNRPSSSNHSFSLHNRSRKSNSHNLTRLSESIRQTILEQDTKPKPTMRMVGNKKYSKPKPVERKTEIIPKHIRDNPFSDPLPVSVNDINKGLFNLLNKGYIAKDVDVSTAFERGQPPIRTRGAILHHFEERMVRDIPQYPQKQIFNKPIAQTITKYQNNTSDWAITGIQQQTTSVIKKKMEDSGQKFLHQSLPQNLDLSILHIEFLGFRVVQNSKSYLELRRKEVQNWGGIKMVIREIEKFMKKYGIRAVFADARRMLALANSLKKIRERSIVQCFVGKASERSKIRSVKNINDGDIKRTMCALVINTAVRCYKLRKEYLRIQKKKLNQYKIVNWIQNRLYHRKFKTRAQERLKLQQLKFDRKQETFISDYQKITSEKHFEVHVPNVRFDITKQQLYQKLNVEVTRIFNIRDPNTNIIYISPFGLAPQIANYYYKILQLGEVQNFKQRIIFLQSDPKGVFNYRFPNSKSLYYSSETLRKLKGMIGSTPAYLVTSYPVHQDLLLANYLDLPILSNIHIAKQLSLRDVAMLKFKELELPVVQNIRIDVGNKIGLSELIVRMGRFSQDAKTRKILMKLNGTSCGNGLAVVNMPINSLDDLYNKTLPVSTVYFNEPKKFYQALLRKGGIIEKTENNYAPIVASVFLNPNKTYQVIGTFDKISSGFVNIGYSFPQQSIYHSELLAPLDKLLEHLLDKGYYGYLDVHMCVDTQRNVFFEKLDCFLTKLTASLFYFRYLMKGKFQNSGNYTTSITDTIVYDEDGNGQAVNRTESRTYVYSPYILHFGLSQIQMKNFFQLCRIEGVSFDLEKKFGSTFILIDTLKSSIGLLTTGQSTKTSVKLMTSTLGFLVKQNQKISNDPVKEKEIRFKEKCNIISVKSRYDELLSLLKTEPELTEETK